MKNGHAVIVSLVLAACAQTKRTQPQQAAGRDRTAYEAAADRALTFEDATGFVITRHPGGQEKNQGDALLFTGLLAASVDCQRGERATAALLEQPPELWRHQLLAGERVSLDGALGFYMAAAWRIKKCGEKERWAPFLTKHKEVGGPDVPAYFDYVRDRLFEEAGVGDAPDDHRWRLEQEVGYWALGVMADHAACYRIHLGLLAFQTLEMLGDHVGGGDFCAYTKTADLPTVDQWCGRSGLEGYLAAYRVNEYQYRHQRCRWEGADGGGDDGLDEQPGIDQLMAFRDLTGVQ